ncbi:hypothetical protein GUJ93_ZPchr0257g6574 [Zizania palustris]|uniref:Uncharacterized protein n=1 Tax=Zizania palustris TaxID=103762 RepID=A0A8J5RNW0_ZIZPA|nr:hypothetical protein GUJ93_ZPchr0257g6574 [Zizania palustris]
MTSNARRARKLSPVSVLELHSDEESSAISGNYEDDKTPSTSGKSSPPQDLGFTFYEASKICKTDTEEDKTTMKSGCRFTEGSRR